MDKKNKKIFKVIFIIVLAGVIYFIFRDTISPIFNNIKHISILGIINITLLSVGYSCIDGINIDLLSRRFNQRFKILKGIGCCLYTCFYRTVTLGSGSYIASIYFLKKNGLSASEAVDVSTINYILHKLSILIFSILCMLINHNFILINFKDYINFIMIVYIINILVIIILLSTCLSKTFHNLLLLILDKVKKKTRFKSNINYIKSEILNLRKSTILLLNNKNIIIAILLGNLLKLYFLYYSSYVALSEMKISINSFDAVTITSLVTILAGVIPTPAGIASIEFVYILLFSVLENTLVVSSSMLVYRFGSFIVPFITGGLYVIFSKIKKLIKFV